MYDFLLKMKKILIDRNARKNQIALITFSLRKVKTLIKEG